MTPERLLAHYDNGQCLPEPLARGAGLGLDAAHPLALAMLSLVRHAAELGAAFCGGVVALLGTLTVTFTH